jgi:hypothetical protein
MKLLIGITAWGLLALDLMAPGQWKFKWVNDANPILQIQFADPPGES